MPKMAWGLRLYKAAFNAQLLTDRKLDMSHQKEDCLEQNKTQGACNSVCAEMAIEIRRKMEELFCRLEKIENELEKQ